MSAQTGSVGKDRRSAMKQIRGLRSDGERLDRAVKPGLLPANVKTLSPAGGYMCIHGSVPIGVSFTNNAARSDIGTQKCLFEGEECAQSIERAKMPVSIERARMRTISQEVRRSVPYVPNEEEHRKTNRVRAGQGPLHFGAPCEPSFPVTIYAKSPNLRPADKEGTHPSRSDEKVLES